MRTSATVMAALEQLEMRFALAEGGATSEDLGTYTSLSNSLRRLLKELGTKRRPRDVTPSVRDYARTLDHDDDPPRTNGHHRVRAAS